MQLSARQSIRRTMQKRRGVASVLAMMYLVLFSALAIGFFSATSMSVQISKNEMYSAHAQKSAESGVEYVRRHLNSVDLRANYNFTDDPVFVALYNQFASGNVASGYTGMAGTGTFHGMSVGLSTDKKTIFIPATTGGGARQWISLDGQFDAASNPTGAAFSATLVHDADKFILKVTGRNGNTTVMRAVKLKFQQFSNSSAIFNYGLVAKGKIVTSGSSWVEGAAGHSDPLGSVLSTDITDSTPVTIGGKGISGDISIVSNGSVSFTGASVGGTNITTVIAQSHIHKQVIPPDFPDIDTSAYAAFATNTFTGADNGTFSNQTYSNIVIPANKNPIFSGNTSINGVMVIIPPNKVKFLGNAKITGVIVAPSVPGGSNPAFDSTNNSITFSGNVTAKDASNLDPATYGTVLPTMTGAFILAPSFSTTFSGSFGTINGSIIAGQVTFNGAAGGTVQGSIISTEPQTSMPAGTSALSVGGSADVVIAGRGTSNLPTGVSFGYHIVPQPDTYDEVAP